MATFSRQTIRWLEIEEEEEKKKEVERVEGSGVGRGKPETNEAKCDCSSFCRIQSPYEAFMNSSILLQLP